MTPLDRPMGEGARAPGPGGGGPRSPRGADVPPGDTRPGTETGAGSGTDPGTERSRGGPGPGFFLVLEGAEGAGKTTQARLLVEWLEEEGVPCRLAREPGGTPVGEAIREVLLDREGLEMPPETELLLILAARAAYVREVVLPALADGVVMISDRFQLSTFAYQGVARGLGVDRARELNAFATGGLEPDLTLVFDVPAEEGRARQERDGKIRDRIEGEGDGFLEAVSRAYRALAAQEPGAVIVDATPSAAEVHDRVRELVAARLPELSGSGRGSE